MTSAFRLTSLSPLRLAATALAAAATCSGAWALPSFTLDPNAAGLNGTGFTADNILISDYSTVTFDGSGGFTERGYLPVSAFQSGGTTFVPTGLNGGAGGYGLYFAYEGMGTVDSGSNPSTEPTQVTFTSVSYTLYGYNGAATFGIDGSHNPTETATGEVALGSGSLVVGTGSTTPLSPSFTPTASTLMTFNAGSSGFFVSPSPFYNLAFASFTNSPSQVSPFTGGFSISQGGGSVNFASAVPEPQTYALMLAGLGALGFVGRRRSRGG